MEAKRTSHTIDTCAHQGITTDSSEAISLSGPNHEQLLNDVDRMLSDFAADYKKMAEE